MGTLLAFAAVCVAVIVMRGKAPDLPRPFRVPLSPVVPAVGAAACLYMMYSLSKQAWWWLGGWIVVGCIVQLFISRRPATTSPT